MQGTSDPDYGRCVDIVTVAALKAMVVPGLLAVAGPVVVGMIFRYFTSPDYTMQIEPAGAGIGGVAGAAMGATAVVATSIPMPVGAVSVAAFLMVGTITGILLATLMNNSGGAWDNAKKYIETGALGGKGSDAHKAAVVGDTVGDPFKDTAGPSLHVLIKLLSTITLVAAPLFI
jgi:K(+)-stimulated pyrophosphate-energized sodium pump